MFGIVWQITEEPIDEMEMGFEFLGAVVVSYNGEYLENIWDFYGECC